MTDHIARYNLKLVRETFSDDDWQDVLARATLFALRLMRGRSESAREAEDYATEAAGRFLDGRRQLTAPLEGVAHARIREFVFMFFCGIIRSIISHEKSVERADMDAFADQRPHHYYGPGMQNLFPSNTLEHAVLQVLLDGDFDVPPRDILVLLHERQPDAYGELTVDEVYAARRRVRDRLRLMLKSDEERVTLADRGPVYSLSVPDSPIMESAFGMFEARTSAVQDVSERYIQAMSIIDIWAELDARRSGERIRSWLYDLSGLRADIT